MTGSQYADLIARYVLRNYSKGILHVLEASHLAAYCLPDGMNLAPSSTTWEFDHMLAMNFGWWDVVIEGKRPFGATGPTGKG